MKAFNKVARALVITGLLGSVSCGGDSAPTVQVTGTAIVRVTGLFPAAGSQLSVGDRISFSYVFANGPTFLVKYLGLEREDGAAIELICVAVANQTAGTTALGSAVTERIADFATGHTVTRVFLRGIESPNFTPGMPCREVTGTVVGESSLTLNWRGPVAG